MPFGGKNLIGIDIGSYSIKAVRLRGRPGSRTLDAASSVRLPKEGSEERVAEYLSGMMRSKRMRSGYGAAVLSGQFLTIRQLSLPAMPEADLREAVRWELRKELAFPVNELVSDFVTSPVGPKTEANAVSVIAFAARRGDVEGLMKTAKESLVELRVVESVPTALLLAFDMSHGWDQGANYAMLDIGERRSTLAILKDSHLGFAREFAFGGAELTERLAEGLGKDRDDAEEYKHAYGLAADGVSEDAKKILTSALHSLSAELIRSFDYYHAQFREAAISKLFISGGTARLKGIEQYLTSSVGIPAFAHDPFRNVKMPKGMEAASAEIAPSLTIAAGLATRTTE